MFISPHQEPLKNVWTADGHLYAGEVSSPSSTSRYSSYQTGSSTRATLFLTSLAHFINDGNAMLIPMLFPLFISQYGFSTLQLAVLAGSYNAVAALVSPIVGHVSDIMRRPGSLMGLGVSLFSLGIWAYSSLAFISTSFIISPVFLYALFVSATLIAGLGSGFYHPLGGSVLQHAYPRPRLGLAMGINGVAGSVGRAIYPTLSVFLITAISLSQGLLFLGAVGVASGGVIYALIRGTESPYHFSMERAGIAKMWNPGVLRKVAVLGLVAGLASLSGQGILSFLPTYLVQARHYSYDLQLGFVISIILATSIVGQPLWGFLSDTVGRRLTLATSVFGTGASFVIHTLMPPNSVESLAALACFGFFSFSGFPVLLSIVSEAVPREFTALANSVVWGFGVVGGGALGPLLVGLLSQGAALGSLESSLFALAIIGVVATVFVPLIPSAKISR